jgi:alpha-tubulin suppressor-like RCC1 family protein
MSTPFRFKNADNTTVDFEDYYVRADYFRSGNLWVWGYNFHGQIGDNTVTNRSSPVQTIAWGSNWKEISSSQYFTAAIKTDGTLWCWGDNTNGNLGDNTSAKKSSPNQTIAYGTNWKEVSCADSSTAAIKTDGTLWCWGYNGGQLGDNTVTNRSSPVQTCTFGTNWKQVGCGTSHVTAIKTDGTLWCWGRGGYGQLGDNTDIVKSSPVQTITFGTNWKQVSCGVGSTAAIKTDGTLWCWGRGDYGQLGNNTSVNRSSPVQTIAGGTNWKQVSAGYEHTAAIKNDGTLWVWGYNYKGQLGDNTTLFRSSPVQTIAGGTNWKQVSCGSATTAIKTDGTLWVWGRNAYGQLGDNTRTDRSSPVQTIMYGTNWQKTTGKVYNTAAIQYQDDYQ